MMGAAPMGGGGMGAMGCMGGCNMGGCGGGVGCGGGMPGCGGGGNTASQAGGPAGITQEQMQVLMQDKAKLQQFLAENPDKAQAVMMMMR